METLLLVVIALLSGVICALGGFWILREGQAPRQGVRSLQIDRPAAGHDRWEAAVRSFRDKA